MNSLFQPVASIDAAIVAMYQLMKRNLITLCAATLLVAGCSTTSTNPIVTPDRVKSVTALGSYIGAKAAIGKGYAPQLQMALDGLNSLKASGSNDLPSAIKAVTDALGPEANQFVNSDEGMLIVVNGAALFTDLWTATVQKPLDSTYGVAVRDGLIEGLTLALQPSVRALSSAGDPTEAQLRAKAVATR